MAYKAILKQNCVASNMSFEKRLSPFCEIVIGNQVIRTQVSHGGGQQPVWNDSFTFRITQKDIEMHLSIIDSENNTRTIEDHRGNKIGHCIIPLDQVISELSVQGTYEIFDERGISSGDVTLLIEFDPEFSAYQYMPNNINTKKYQVLLDKKGIK